MFAQSRKSLRLGLACMTALGSISVLAPRAHGAEAGVIEEVVVTATKRGAQSMQKVPFAVQAIGGKQLSDRGAVDFNDFFHLISGLSVFDQGPGDKRIILRGVNAVGAGTVGLYLDEAIVTGENAQDGGGRQPDIRLFDIDRIEVLKGPQGTTFGSSSLSGTIRYITKKPEVDRFEGYVNGGLRTVKGGNIGGQTEAALNIPVVKDRVAVRLSSYYLNEDGFIDNIFRKGVNNDETYAGRAEVRFIVADGVTFDLMAMYQDTSTDGPAFYNRVDFDGNPISQNGFFQADVTQNGFDDKLQIYNGTLKVVRDFGTFVATASDYRRRSTFNRDASFALEAFAGLDRFTSGRSIITQPKKRELQSYEVRFASSWNSPFQVLVGAFYQGEDRFFRSAILAANSDGNIIPNGMSFLDRNVTTNIDQVAIFGELSVSVTDRLTVTGGFRWFDISIDEVANAVVGFGGGPGSGVGPKLSSTDDDVISKFNISFQATDQLLMYAQRSEGFRSGGTNDQTAAEIANVIIPSGFKSDSLKNYEIGVKDSAFDGRLSFDVAAFLINWTNIQLQDQATDGQLTFPFIGNGGGARIKGIEAGARVFPIEGLEFDATAAVTSAHLTKDNPVPSSGMNGDRIPETPRVTLSFSAQYERDLGNEVTGRVGGDVFYVSGRNTELRPDNPLFVRLDSYTIVNLRAGVAWRSWSAMLNVNNVGNDTTTIDIFRIVPGLTPDGLIPNRPRTVVFTVNKAF